MLIDTNGNLFIADSNNNRVAYWLVNATESYIVAGTGVLGSWINLLNYPAAVVGGISSFFLRINPTNFVCHFSLE
jgi:hypothetical protein